MARFDPSTYPDRLAFESHAHALRRAEHDRLLKAAADFLARQWRRVAGSGRQPVGAGSLHERWAR